MLSPTAGVGARERSMMPNGTLRRSEASLATSCPTRVILKAVFLTVSHKVSKSAPLTCETAFLTTPGPLTPIFTTASDSVTPWNAPAMNGLSSGALQNTTSFAQPIESLPFVSSAVSLIIEPMRLTASMFIPVFVDARLTELHTLSVEDSALGIERIRSSSALVIPLGTNAE